MKYGDVALGVECALPPAVLPARRRSPARRLLAWLFGALVRRA